MRRHLSVFLTFLCSSFMALNPTPALAKCGGNGGQVAGAVVGGVVGGFLGHGIAGGRDKTIGTLLGGTLGAFVGSRIGKSLDTCEQEKVAQATQLALNDSESDQTSTQTWTSESRENVNGTVEASPSQTLADGRVCREVTQVNYVDGQEVKDTPRFCRTPPRSTWAPA